MKISEAMICLSIQLEVKHRLGKDYEANALQLGIEALKRVEHVRTLHKPNPLDLLLGETPEN